MFLENLPSHFVIGPIVDRVKAGLVETMQQTPLAEVQRKVADARPVRNFEAAVSSKFGLIAEIKRCSPSIGQMKHGNIPEIAAAYEASSAVTAISVLTNPADFGMDAAKLDEIGKLVTKPILRKEFIFDPYQVWEARAHGADAILLMATILTPEGLTELSHLAESLGMSVLFESHTKDELAKIPKNARVWGINSRVFKSEPRDFQHDGSRVRGFLAVSDPSIKSSQFDLISELPAHAIRVAESGVDPSMISKLRDELRFNCVLVGTSLLMAPNGVKDALQQFEAAIDEPVKQPIHPPFVQQHAA